MNSPHHSGRNLRLLAVALQENHPTVNFAQLATLPGFELIDEAADYNDGLRLTLMTRPDVIVLPWSLGAMKLLRALDHLREEGLAPLVVAVVPETLPSDLPPRDGMAVIGIDQFDGGLAARLRRLLADQANQGDLFKL